MGLRPSYTLWITSEEDPGTLPSQVSTSPRICSSVVEDRVPTPVSGPFVYGIFEGGRGRDPRRLPVDVWRRVGPDEGRGNLTGRSPDRQLPPCSERARPREEKCCGIKNYSIHLQTFSLSFPSFSLGGRRRGRGPLPTGGPRSDWNTKGILPKDLRYLYRWRVKSTQS